MPLLRSLLWVPIVAVVGLIDLMWLRSWPWLPMLLHVTLLTVILVGLVEGLTVSLTVAVVAGGLYGLASATTGWPYWWSFPLAVWSGWFFLQRIATTRSLASFLATIAVATIVYYVSLWLSTQMISFFGHATLRLPAATVLELAAIQMVVHPLVAVGLWRLLGRHRYERLPAGRTAI